MNIKETKTFKPSSIFGAGHRRTLTWATTIARSFAAEQRSSDVPSITHAR